MQETWAQSLSWEDPLEKGWQPTPVFVPGELHGQKSLAGYSPWSRKELDMTEQLSPSVPLRHPWQYYSHFRDENTKIYTQG